MVALLPRIVLVEGNPDDTRALRERLTRLPNSPLAIDTAPTLSAAITLLSLRPADAVILALDLPDSRGLQTLRSVRAAAGAAPIIVVSGGVDEALRQQFLAEGAEDVLDQGEANSHLVYRNVLYVIEHHRAGLQHRRLQHLLDTTPDAIVVVNGAGVVRFVNQAAVDLFGRPREDLLREALAFSAPEGEPVEIMIWRHGEARVCELCVVGFVWDGEPAQLATIRDLTMRRQTDMLRARSLELQAQNERIQEASRLKSEFLANVSHEIRTPMNAVIGLSHLLQRTALDADQRAMVANIQRAGRGLLGLIDNVLDLSKIEAGAIVLEEVTFDPGALMHDAAQMVAAQAAEKGLALVVHPLPQAPVAVRGDAGRTRQILLNLLANAVKFTARGQVELSASRADLGDGRVALRFAVRDTGIGIAPAVLARLFMPFVQADASTSRRFGGTGLGLSIVRKLAERMGGEAGVRSECGIGSEFSVTLPFGLTDDDPVAAVDGADALRVIVIEPASPGIGLGALAAALGWSIVDEARSPADPPADMLLVDGRVGAATTGERLRRLAAARAPAALPPMVLLARPASSIPAWPEAAAAHTVETIDDEVELFNAASAALWSCPAAHERLERLTAIDEVEGLWLDGVRVLLVDDSAINCEVAQRVLQAEGAQVRSCGNGREAMAQLFDPDQAFDVVLMDVQMPQMDGYAATRAIRADAELARLPVVALTAGALRSQRQRALDSGMDDFICKPFDPATLVRTLRRHAARARGAALPVRARPAAAQTASVDASAWPVLEGIDAGAAARRFDGDLALFEAMLRRLLGAYADLAGVAAPATVMAVEADPASWRARLHKLSGSAAMLGAGAVHHAADAALSALVASAGAENAFPSATASAAVPGQGSNLAAALGRLAGAWRSLAAAAGGWLAACPDGRPDGASPPRATTDTAPASDALAPRQLARLLAAQDLSARAVFHAMAPGLRRRLGDAAFEDLRRGVDGLDFAAALAALERACPEAREDEALSL